MTSPNNTDQTASFKLEGKVMLSTYVKKWKKTQPILVL